MKTIFKTPSAQICVNVLYKEVPSILLSTYQNKNKFDSLCQIGCTNFERKWSCPPYSPSYTDFTSKYEKILVLLLFAELWQFSYIKNDYLKIKAANSIMKSRVDKSLRLHLSDDSYYISTGSCRMCKPCKCKLHLPCAHPDKMSYSFEALGIDVSQMLLDIFDFKLQWYNKGKLPQYTSVVAGLLFNNCLDLQGFLNTSLLI